MYGHFTTSHAGVNVNIAIDIANTGRYDVTILQPHDSQYVQKLQQHGIKVIVFPELNEFEKEKTKPRPLVLPFKMTQVEQLFNKGQYILDKLKEERFDMFITEWHHYIEYLVNYLEIPLHIQQLSIIDSLITNRFSLIPTHSSQINQGKIRLFRMTRYNSLHDLYLSFHTRFLHTFSIVLDSAWLLFDHYLTYQQIKKNQYGSIQKIIFGSSSKKRPNLFILPYIESGINPPIALPPDVKFIYPKYKQAKGLDSFDPDLEDFYERHDKIVYFSFGTAPFTRPNVIRIMLKFAEQRHDYGFLMQVKDTQLSSLNDMTKMMLKSMPNVHYKDWFPQPEILKHHKTKIFISHGGKNSLFESVENAVPVVIYPQSPNDQSFHCEYVEAMNIGKCLFELNLNILHDSFDQLEKNGYFQRDLQQLKQSIYFHKQNAEDYIYWIDYVFEIGTDHLNPKQFKSMNYFTYNDTDIHFTLYGMIILLLFSFLAIVTKLIAKIMERFVRQKCEY